MQRRYRLLANLLFPLVLLAVPAALSAQTTALDRPEITRRLFLPRPEPAPARPDRDAFATAPDGTRLHVRFHLTDKAVPTLLLFHGNGEIASDYDGLAPLLAARGLNLVVAEFRGYGLSGATPEASKLPTDAAESLAFVQARLAADGYGAGLLVMGRSLGSACALFLAATQSAAVDGLVLESAFAATLPLLRVLGVDTSLWGVREADGFANIEHARRYAGPTCILHGAEDRLIDPGDARTLYAVSPARHKRLLLIPQAGHNSVFTRGREQYLDALADLAATATALRRQKTSASNQ